MNKYLKIINAHNMKDLKKYNQLENDNNKSKGDCPMRGKCKVFDMTQPGIEPRSPRQLTNSRATIFQSVFCNFVQRYKEKF